MTHTDYTPPEDRMRSTSQATQSVSDPRVTKGISIAVGLMGVAALSIGTWIGATLVGLRESVATIVAQNAALIQRLDKNDVRDDAQDLRMNNIDGRVYTLEGKNLRGVHP